MAYLVPTLFGLGLYLSFNRAPRRLEAAAVAWASGWATVNLVSFLANQVASIPLDGRFYLVTSLVLGAAGIGLIVRRRTELRAMTRGPFMPSDLKRGLGAALFLSLSVFLVFVLYKSLIIYPVHPDELIYHMELPKIAWQTGFLPVHPGIDLVDQATAYPDLLVTQQLWIYLGASTFDPGLVRVITPIYAALLVLLVFFDARRWFGLAAAGLAAAALLSLWNFSSLAILLMDEWPVALYSYLGLHFAVEALQREGAWTRAGLFMGLAGLVKYDALAALLALGLALIVATHWRPRSDAPGLTRPSGRETVTRALGFYVVALLPVLPISIRNLLVLGNPVYPYFLGGADAQLSPQVVAVLSSPFFAASIWSSELVSLLATLLVAGALIGFLRARAWCSTERLLVLMAAFYLPPYFVYPLLGSQIRYLAPVLPAAALFAGRQIEWWLRETAPRQRLAGGLIVVALAAVASAVVAWAPFYGGFSQQVPLMTLGIFAASSAVLLALVSIAHVAREGTARRALAFGLVLVLLAPGAVAVAAEKSEANPFSWQPNLLPQPQDTYLSTRLGPDWGMWTWMNANLPANAGVLSFDPRVFYLDARVVQAMSPDMLQTQNMTLAQAVAYVRSQGIGYVLDSAFGRSLFLNYLYVNASPIYQNLANATYFRPIHADNSTVLYAIVG